MNNIFLVNYYNKRINQLKLEQKNSKENNPQPNNENVNQIDKNKYNEYRQEAIRLLLEANKDLSNGNIKGGKEKMMMAKGILQNIKN